MVNKRFNRQIEGYSVIVWNKGISVKLARRCNFFEVAAYIVIDWKKIEPTLKHLQSGGQDMKKE